MRPVDTPHRASYRRDTISDDARNIERQESPHAFHSAHRPGRRPVSRQGQAVVLDAPRTMRLVRHVPRQAGPGEAQVRVHAVGISRSDRDVYLGRRPVPYVRYPVTPGHEWSGTVTAVGEGAPASLLGRKVVGEGLRNCETCAPCRDGDTNLCTAGYE
ncbi:dehydrogenase [Streptomyces venezuelae ATCC 10712]|uniref:Dehydrogenase n=1 Tax=Streptomyces venezuelae (strain ATCC 10712 / CBS 650.69 / DSM 40230 / JCM 4526 / NBRC 13096 / PD 04745) TaxID=953739 RepID=F2RHQ8_STRVP|nr:dehydrogenase [Streptomyces venezuelae ATCC 10712]